MSGPPKVHVDYDPDAIAKLAEAMRSDSYLSRIIRANRLRNRYPRSRHAAALLVSSAATAIGLVSLLVAYLTDVRAIATVGGLVTLAGGLLAAAIVCWSPREW
jgi:hypothetical protein